MKTMKFKCRKCGTSVSLNVGDFATHIPTIICPECKVVIREAEETGADRNKSTKLTLLEE